MKYNTWKLEHIYIEEASKRAQIKVSLFSLLFSVKYGLDGSVFYWATTIWRRRFYLKKTSEKERVIANEKKMKQSSKQLVEKLHSNR